MNRKGALSSVPRGGEDGREGCRRLVVLILLLILCNGLEPCVMQEKLRRIHGANDLIKSIAQNQEQDLTSLDPYGNARVDPVLKCSFLF